MYISLLSTANAIYRYVGTCNNRHFHWKERQWVGVWKQRLCWRCLLVPFMRHREHSLNICTFWGASGRGATNSTSTSYHLFGWLTLFVHTPQNVRDDFIPPYTKQPHLWSYCNPLLWKPCTLELWIVRSAPCRAPTTNNVLTICA